MSGLTSPQALAVARRAVPVALGRAVTDVELWAVLAVGRKESGWGNWDDSIAADMRTSRNWGAIQCAAHADRIRYLEVIDPGPDGRAEAERRVGELGVPSAVAGHCAMTLDYRPRRGWFVAPYRWYATDDAAAADLAQLLERRGVLAGVRAGPDTWTLAALMFRTGYYTGTSGTDAEIGSYARELARHVREMAAKLGVASPPLAPVENREAAPGGGGTFPDPDRDRRARVRSVRERFAAVVVRRATYSGSTDVAAGADVRVLQEDLNLRGAGLRVDGHLGPVTLAAWLLDRPEEP